MNELHLLQCADYWVRRHCHRLTTATDEIESEREPSGDRLRQRVRQQQVGEVGEIDQWLRLLCCCTLAIRFISHGLPPAVAINTCNGNITIKCADKVGREAPVAMEVGP